ncbi:MAG: flagellar motor switch protein FliN [Phycisphaerales bacterium]|nr:MAG: flagellar motor switch protein FliN [Phycisphaerales bacterium]
MANDPNSQSEGDASVEGEAFEQVEIDALSSGALEDAPVLEQSSAGDAATAPQDVTASVVEEAPSTSGPVVQEDVDAKIAAAQSTQEAGTQEDSNTAAARVPPAQAEARPFAPRELGVAGLPEVEPSKVSILSDVKLKVKIELGRTSMLVEDVLELGEGSVVELDKLAGDPVEVYANERLVARGEVLILNDNFCVRISEVVSNDPHRVTT